MLLTMLIIAGFQSWWLRNSYVNEELQLKKEISLILRETGFEAQFGGMLPRNGDGPKMMHEPDFVVFDGESKTMTAGRVTGGDSTPGRMETKISITLGPGDLPGGRIRRNFDTSIHTDSLPSHYTLRIRPLQQHKLDSVFRIRLDKSALPVQYVLYRSTMRDSIPSSTGLLVTTPVPAGFDHESIYRAVIGNYAPLILKRLLPQIIVSLFIVLITIFSFLLLYRNLLSQKRLAEQKNQFISNITHELKTPIATVSVALEALQNFNAMHDPARTREYLDISQKELQRLSLLVDKVLKLSMFENDQLVLNRETLNLDELVREVSGSMKLQLEKNQAQLSYTATGSNFTIDADRLHMVSVLFNLLDNALKYGGEKPVIEIELSEAGADLQLVVRDKGIGIPPEYTKKIFEKFFRVPQGDRHNVKGYGLGLSYVAGIVHKHGGSIDVTSTPGKGSSFIIRLPQHHG